MNKITTISPVQLSIDAFSFSLLSRHKITTSAGPDQPAAGPRSQEATNGGRGDAAPLDGAEGEAEPAPHDRRRGKSEGFPPWTDASEGVFVGGYVGAGGGGDVRRPGGDCGEPEAGVEVNGRGEQGDWTG